MIGVPAPRLRRGGGGRGGADGRRRRSRPSDRAGARRELARLQGAQAGHVVDALPRNAMGKVQKAKLRKAHTQTIRS